MKSRGREGFETRFSFSDFPSLRKIDKPVSAQRTDE